MSVSTCKGAFPHLGEDYCSIVAQSTMSTIRIITVLENDRIFALFCLQVRSSRGMEGWTLEPVVTMTCYSIVMWHRR